MLKRVLITLSATVFLFGVLVGPVHGQDSSQSLGDAARQARLKKQQQEAAANDPQAKAAADSEVVPTKAARVITNDEIPSHIGPTRTASNSQRSVTYVPPPSDSAGAADAMKQQFLAAKSRIASMEAEISRASESIRFASGNCVANCVQHNERQLQKQQQVETMKAQLEEQKRQLEQQQEAARRQGYGSSVYDP
jgi:hypothetical protein